MYILNTNEQRKNLITFGKKHYHLLRYFGYSEITALTVQLIYYAY